MFWKKQTFYWFNFRKIEYVAHVLAKAGVNKMLEIFLFKDWCESVTVTIYKKGKISSFENLRPICLVSIASRLLADILLHRLSNMCERCMHENHTDYSVAFRVVCTKLSFREIYWNTGKCSVDSGFPFSLIWKLRQSCSPVAVLPTEGHVGGFIYLSNLRMRTTRATFALMGMLHSNSARELVLVRVVPFHVLLLMLHSGQL